MQSHPLHSAGHISANTMFSYLVCNRHLVPRFPLMGTYAGRAWYLFSCEHGIIEMARIFRAERQRFTQRSPNFTLNSWSVGYSPVIGKWKKFTELTGRISHQLHTQRSTQFLVCRLFTPRYLDIWSKSLYLRSFCCSESLGTPTHN